MDAGEYPPIPAKLQIKYAAESFDPKKHPGIRSTAVLKDAVVLLEDVYDAGRKRGIAPAAWGWVANLPTACLILAHRRRHPG